MLYGDKDEIIPREPSLGVMRKLPKGGGNKLGIYPTVITCCCATWRARRS